MRNGHLVCKITPQYLVWYLTNRFASTVLSAFTSKLSDVTGGCTTLGKIYATVGIFLARTIAQADDGFSSSLPRNTIAAGIHRHCDRTSSWLVLLYASLKIHHLLWKFISRPEAVQWKTAGSSSYWQDVKNGLSGCGCQRLFEKGRAYENLSILVAVTDRFNNSPIQWVDEQFLLNRVRWGKRQ